MRKAKTWWILGIAALILLLILGGFLWLRSRPANSAEQFLTVLYTSDATRFEQLSEQTSMLTPTDGNTGILPIPEQAFSAYREIFAPMMTPKGLEVLFANGDATAADSYAARQQATLTVKSVSLTPESSTSEVRQYRFAAKLSVSGGSGEQSLSPEGTVTLRREGGGWLVDTFKPYDRTLLR